MNEPLQIELRGADAWLTLNRPGAGNTIDVALAEALGEAAEQCATDGAVRAGSVAERDVEIVHVNERAGQRFPGRTRHGDIRDGRGRGAAARPDVVRKQEALLDGEWIHAAADRTQIAVASRAVALRAAAVPVEVVRAGFRVPCSGRSGRAGQHRSTRRKDGH